MSTTKVRCAGCGAKNDGEATKCRICGKDLRNTAEQPLTMPRAGSEEMRSARLSGLMAMAVGGVLAVGLLALLLGVVEGPKWLSDARNKLPLVGQQADDGWTAFTEPVGRWRAEMPVNRVESPVAFPASTTATAQQWLAPLGGVPGFADTELSVIWTTVATADGENVEATLASTAEQWAAQLGGQVERNSEASFQGLPARRLTISGLRQGDERATIDALLIRRREQLVILQSRSIYGDHPQFVRLAEGFSFL